MALKIKTAIVPNSSNLRGHVINNHPNTGLPASINADPHDLLSDPAIPVHDRVPAFRPSKTLTNSPKSPTAAGKVVD